MVQDQSIDPLFTALAEQLKVPLLQITRMSELNSANTLPRIAVISEQALTLVDAYLQARDSQTVLTLEPLAASSVLYEAAESLSRFAKQSNCSIEIDQVGRSVPIMANRRLLKTILVLLGSSLITADIEEEDSPRQLILGTHQSAKGIVVGVFSRQVNLSQRVINLAKQLHGRAAQSAPALGVSGGAGLVIADLLSQHLQSPLRSYRHRSMSGVGNLLLPSHQLQLL